jgi:hypothetical protein
MTGSKTPAAERVGNADSLRAKLREMTRAAIEAANGDVFRAKLALARNINSTTDCRLLREFYAPVHNEALDKAIGAGFKALQKEGKFLPKSRRPPPSPTGASREPLAASSEWPEADTPEHPRGPVVAPALQTDTTTLLSDAAYMARAAAIRRSALDIFQVNGKALRHTTGLEAREYIEHHHAQARFVAMCVNGVPDHVEIGAAITDDEADEFYRECGFNLPEPK